MTTQVRRQSTSSVPVEYDSYSAADFASDRSPLQKVETIVNGMREDMSKEERRQQVLHAEEKLHARRGKAPAVENGSGGGGAAAGRSSRYADAGADADGGYYYDDPAGAVDSPQRGNPAARTSSTRTDYRNYPPARSVPAGAGASAAAADEEAAGVRRQARANLYNSAAPVSDQHESEYPPVRTNSRRRSDGGPRVLTKPPPPDMRAVSDSYGQPPARQRSVREGRVFDTDPGYIDQYDEPARYVDGRSNGDYVDGDGYGSPKQSGGVMGRVKSIFRRKRASAPMPVTDPYMEPEPQSPPVQQRDHHFFRRSEDARRYEQPQYQDYRRNIRTTNIADPDGVPPPVPAKDPLPAPTTPGQPDNRAWWEKPAPSSTDSRRRSAGPAAPSAAVAAQISPPRTSNVDASQGQYQTRQQPAPTQQTYFQPQLYLRCGPLLRFTGIRKSSRNAEREVWTGSIMVVTVDSKSRYEPAPNLRIFKQPVDLLPPPPQHIDEASGQQLPPEYVDPIAGQIKMSRVGKTLYVKPVEALEEKRDLSRIEDDSGLFEEFRSQPYQLPTAKGTTGGLRQVGQDGELRGKFQDITAFVLHRERGVTFWKWNLEIELSSTQVRLAYRINRGPAIGFWIPARGETMNMMFHSCNGFSLSVNTDEFSGPDPLWRDVLNTHQTRPFHVMLGGGDQIYMDAATVQTRLFGEWSKSRNAHWKHTTPFTREMQEEMEKFFLNRYAMWFSQGLFGMANSQIPMVNVWDDHDIIDGFGSYPDHTMRSPVMSGVGNVAFKYYMLFQHQSLPIEDERTEPSWLLGHARGPYITERSRSLFMRLGRKTAFLGLDCRTERMRDEIMSQETWDLVFARLRREIKRGEMQHLIVMLGVPIAYPRLNFLENVLTSRAMDPIKALGRTGALGGFVNKFDGGVEILDDLDDHWTARHHKDERNWFIQELQELAADLSVRVTILSGDVHLGAVGQFYSNKALGLPKDQDHRYMPNVISSAIVNTPPTDMVADILNKRNKIHHLDEETDENMMPMFPEDVNEKKRNNKHLLPRRNWCSIREYRPELTPPPTPSDAGTGGTRESSVKRRGSLTRRLSGSGLPGAGLIRRLSQRGGGAGGGQRNSASHPPVAFNQRPHDESYFSQPRRSYDAPRRASADMVRAPGPASEGDLTHPQRPNPFMRRPTVLLPHNPTHMINLRGGLDIRLNCENERGDPAGTTTEYRLIVPALDYRGDGDPNPEAFKPKGRLGRLVRGLSQRHVSKRGGPAGYDSYDDSDQEWEAHNRPVPAAQAHAHAQPARRVHGNESWDSLQQDPVPAAKPLQQEQVRARRHRDSLPANEIQDVPLPASANAAGVKIGANGLPLRNKSRTAANTSEPVVTGAGVSMRRQDGSAGGVRPDTYAGPNTIIPDTLPPPPPGGPGGGSGKRRESAGAVGGGERGYFDRA